MGIQEFLDETDSEAQPKDSGLSEWINGSQEDQKLGTAVKYGAQKNPDQAARILKLQTKTGLPADLIERNLDEIEKQSQAADFDPVQFRKASPIVADWLSEHPNNAAVAKEDLASLSYIERQLKAMGSQFQKGMLTNELSEIGQAAYMGTVTSDQRRRQAEIEKALTEHSDNYGIKGFFEGIPSVVANQIPIQANIMGGATKQAVIGATMGAAMGGAVGGPPLAAAGMTTGLGSGFFLGTGIETAKMEGSLAYLEFEKLKDDKGLPLNRETALGAAAVTGVVNGILEIVPEMILAKNIPGLRALRRDSVKELLKNPSIRELFQEYGKNVAESSVAEGVTEWLQEMVKNGAGELAQMQQAGTLEHTSARGIISRIFSEQHLQEAAQSGIAGAQGGGGMSASFGSISLAGDIAKNKQAQNTSDAFLDLGEKIKNTKLFERLPGALQSIMQRLVKDGPIEKVYIPIESWNEYWSGQGVDAKAVAEEVLGSANTYSEAIRTGQDLAVPTEKYAAHIAPSDHNKFFVQELRSAPDALNAREVAENEKEQQEEHAQKEKLSQEITQLEGEQKTAVEDAQAKEKESQDIKDSFAKQLQESGFDAETSDAYSQLFEVFRTGGENLKINPTELFKQYEIKINRKLEEAAPRTDDGSGGNTFNQSAMPPRQLAPPFYHKIQKTIDEKMGPSATVEQVRGVISSIKDEERKWSGIDEFLKGKDKVSKAELLEFLKGNQIEIEEIQKGGETKYFAVAPGAKYESYTLPGGSNYKELLFRLSSETSAVIDRRKELAAIDRERPLTTEEQKEYDQLVQDTKGKSNNVYQSSHWQEANVLFHVRINDHVDSDGNKVIVVQEFQSDWLQEGRDKGFKDPNSNNEGQLRLYNEVITQQKKLSPLLEANNNLGYENEDAARVAIQDRLESVIINLERVGNAELSQQVADYQEAFRAWQESNTRGVPDAPLKKTWHEAALRRMIRYAAENGYDKLAWTTGRQQAERWGQISTIDSAKLVTKEAQEERGAGKYYVHQTKSNGTLGNYYTEQAMREEFGDSASDQIIKSLKNSAEDVEVPLKIEIGGEGMKGFYDGIIPQYLNKFGKRFGAKVSTATIKTGLTEKDVQRENQRQQEENQFVSIPADAVQDTQVHSFPITQSMKDSALKEGFSLFQPGPGAPRGRITFNGKQIDITLLKDADLSTFLHETGHFYLRLLNDLSSAETAPQSLKDDMQIALKFLGGTSYETLTVEQQEKWTDAVEDYLMTGKAPTASLRKAFAKFRAWLLAIYRQNARIMVITPEVRGVLDRMLASQEQIDATQHEEAMQPFYAEPEAFGMVGKTAVEYHNAIEQAKLSAQEELTTAAVKEFKKAEQSFYKENKERVREEITEEVNQRPEYMALSALQQGKFPDGTELPPGLQGMKLSRQAIVEQFGGEARLKTLPKPYVYSKEGGIHPDDVAFMFGYSSGDELLTVLAATENRKQLIERLTEQTTKERFGEVLTDEQLHEEAVKAVHNLDQAKVLHKELEHLVSQEFATFKKLLTKIANPLPKLEFFTEQAKLAIGKRAPRDIIPGVYQRAEVRSAKEAIEFLKKGDWDAAFEAKHRQLLNHELYRAAIEAKEEVESTVNYMQKFQKSSTRQRLGKAGGDYLEQIDAITERFDFNPNVSLRAIDRRKTLLEFVQEQIEQGFPVSVPQELLDEANRKHYKDTTLEELRSIKDTVETIEHLARVKNKLLALDKARSFLEVQSEIVSGINAHHNLETGPRDPTPGWKDRLTDDVDNVRATHTRLEFLFLILDGNKPNGPAWRYFFKPVADAENARNTKMREVSTKLEEIFKEYPKAERAKWFYEKTYIKEIQVSMTKGNILALALNQGNSYNRSAVIEGNGYSEVQVQAVLDHMSKKDWDTVQKIWDYIDSFWPEIEVMEKALNGVAPEKVKAETVKTKYGEYRGGYYPILFDSKNSFKQFQLEEKSATQDLFGGTWSKAMTKHGFTKERQNTGGKPILLNLSGLSQHLSDVVLDITHRPTVIDVYRLINNEEVRTSIENSIGKEMYKQLNPWLKNIAGDRGAEPISKMESLLGSARTATTIVNMGWKGSTALMQVTGYSMSAKELGPKYAAFGVKGFIRNPATLFTEYKKIAVKSEMMRDRLDNYDRDIRETAKRLNISNVKFGPFSVIDAYTSSRSKSYFYMIGMIDLAISIPTWLGAYQQAMDGALENIKKGDEISAIAHADSVVRQTQGAGAAKDLAAVQRGGEAWKLFTTFFSYMDLVFNQLQKTGYQYKFDKNKMVLLASLALIWFGPAIWDELIVGRGPDDDEDKLKWLAKKEFLYPFQTIVLMRDIATGLDRKMEGGMSSSKGSPVFDVYDTLATTLNIPFKAMDEDHELARSDYKAALMTVGYFAKLPTRQIWLSCEYIHDYMTGEEDPDNPAEFLWRGLVTGKKKK